MLLARGCAGRTGGSTVHGTNFTDDILHSPMSPGTAPVIGESKDGHAVAVSLFHASHFPSTRAGVRPFTSVCGGRECVASSHYTHHVRKMSGCGLRYGCQHAPNDAQQSKNCPVP